MCLITLAVTTKYDILCHIENLHICKQPWYLKLLFAKSLSKELPSLDHDNLLERARTRLKRNWGWKMLAQKNVLDTMAPEVRRHSLPASSILPMIILRIHELRQRTKNLDCSIKIITSYNIYPNLILVEPCLAVEKPLQQHSCILFFKLICCHSISLGPYDCFVISSVLASCMSTWHYL